MIKPADTSYHVLSLYACAKLATMDKRPPHRELLDP